jgi:REP element-mobilizing transposase RayT
MPRTLRAEQFDPKEICIVHLVQRCVRRAYLAGQDAVTGKDYGFRREWIRCRMERLASVFGIDILTYAILSNHMHLVVRTRPDVVQAWTNDEVALRWLRIFPGKRFDEQLAEPTTVDVRALAGNMERIAVVRARLSDPSWFMRALSEPIARLANRQDECTGSFWEGRFKAQTIADEAGLLACSMYVDLNPIRAALAESPEQAVHTSAYDRIAALQGKTIPSAAAELVAMEPEEKGKIIRTSTQEMLRKRKAEMKKKRGPSILRDAWLSPLTLDERGKPGPQVSKSNVRASDKGFLSIKLEGYLKLLDWTGRQRSGEKASIPAELLPILDRLGIAGEMWRDLVWNFKRYFGRSSAAGSPQSLKDSAAKRNREFAHGQKLVRKCFTA